eukprot:TRINITY_DN2361_c0_g1_i1.p1 TRINITY_DN2361_c0_g1~~TRINITY_DN2361_c0_g1_i1.p1  ORF type:complete len:326 (+),score=80.80 TRINITY_DN2361_c0_g1_i1:37-1014(+)
MMLCRVLHNTTSLRGRGTLLRGTLLPSRTNRATPRFPHFPSLALATPKRHYFVERPLHEMTEIEEMASWVYNVDGESVPFYSLLDNRVLLVFLRHFGDACTIQQIETLKKYKEQILATNTNILLIGNGNPGRAKAFIKLDPDLFRCSFPGPIVEMYSDIEQKIYYQFGLKRGIWRALSPEYLHTMSPKSLSKNGMIQGDPWQLGGLFVIEEEKVYYEHFSEKAGDHANMEEVMLVLRKLYELNQAVGEYVYQEGEKEGKVPPKIPEDAIVVDQDYPDYVRHLFPTLELSRSEKEELMLARQKEMEKAKKPKRIWTKIAEKIFKTK